MSHARHEHANGQVWSGWITPNIGDKRRSATKYRPSVTDDGAVSRRRVLARSYSSCLAVGHSTRAQKGRAHVSHDLHDPQHALAVHLCPSASTRVERPVSCSSSTTEPACANQTTGPKASAKKRQVEGRGSPCRTQFPSAEVDPQLADGDAALEWLRCCPCRAVLLREVWCYIICGSGADGRRICCRRGRLRRPAE
jgi:hypothetical protein